MVAMILAYEITRFTQPNCTLQFARGLWLAVQLLAMQIALNALAHYWNISIFNSLPLQFFLSNSCSVAGIFYLHNCNEAACLCHLPASPLSGVINRADAFTANLHCS